MLSKITNSFFVGLLSAFLFSPVHALESENNDALDHVKITMLMEHEGFLLWYAKQQGWDRDLGINLELSIVNSSGLDILNEKREHRDQWDVTCIGAVPAIVASEDIPIKIFGIANDESYATDIMVQKDSEILNVKGWSREYPNVYGDPESIKGKTFFLRYGTSSIYALSNWLNIFGLKEEDVNIVDTTTAEAMKKMNNREGDGMVLWAPENYEALKQGHQIVAHAAQVGAFVPVVFVADYDYAEKHPDILAKILALYDRVVQIHNDDVFKLILSYKQFLMLYTGKVFNEDFCIYDLKSHPTYSISEQITLFTSTREYTSGMETLEQNIVKKFEKLPNKSSGPLDFFGKKYKRETTSQYLKESLRYQKNNYKKIE
ncbi:ABC transporter substrate-binding protein [Succinivibrio sp.]|uniref:ABC transporter substrate-binding protein n=1 Tax=Succinivibrio sp. TaxID=2053619 RepID=UPI0038658675